MSLIVPEPAAMSIEIALSSRRGEFALNVSCSVPSRGITALFGPSGCGKTSLLRCIAGLDASCRGHIIVGGECWQDDGRQWFVPSFRRTVGYVFQESVLFDHMTVEQNLRFGWSRVPPEKRRIGFDDAVTLLGLSPFLHRVPATLSGGEKQRIALCRAVLTSPDLLLLDEPVSALDDKNKDEQLMFIERLRDEVSLPIVYVSHSIAEVSRLADHLLVMKDGAISMAGPMEALLADPRCPLTRGSEAGVTVKGTVIAHDREFCLTSLSCGEGTLSVALRDDRPGSMVRIGIKARDVSISLSRPSDSSVLNSLPVVVTHVADDGPVHALLCLASGETRLIAHITRKSAHSLGLAPGKRVFANIKTVAIDE
jgi:molybdate transport system ATP-binding protein